MQLIATPLGWIMRWIYNLVGNYGVTLILFTLITKILLLPLSVKQKKSMIRMNAFQPEIQRIQKKYATDTQKQQEELSRLQKEHNFSMTSGCLPMLIQMPILFGMIDVIYKPLRHIVGVKNALITDTLTPMAEKMLGTLSRYSPQTDIIKAIKQAPQAFAEVLDPATISAVQELNLTFLGLDLTATPSIKVFNALLLIPVVSVVLMLGQQFITQKLNGQQSNSSTTAMMLMTTLMFGYFSFMMPAGVSIYWIFSSFFAILQELILRLFIDPEKEKLKIEEEIYEARKARKEKEKQRPAKVAKAKEKAKDKYVEETYESEEEAEKAKQRLAKARAMDKAKYGD